ncbi:unnamed protein product, partial [Phaeothamnion confervicola]
MAIFLCVYTLNAEPAAPGEAPNAFEFSCSQQRRAPLLADLLRASPLGPRNMFSVLQDDGTYLDVVNPSALLPMRDGIVTAKVVTLAEAPRVSREAVREEAARGPRRPRAKQSSFSKPTYQGAEKPFNSPGGGSNGGGGGGGGGSSSSGSNGARLRRGSSGGSGSTHNIFGEGLRPTQHRRG